MIYPFYSIRNKLCYFYVHHYTTIRIIGFNCIKETFVVITRDEHMICETERVFKCEQPHCKISDDEKLY